MCFFVLQCFASRFCPERTSSHTWYICLWRTHHWLWKGSWCTWCWCLSPITVRISVNGKYKTLSATCLPNCFLQCSCKQGVTIQLYLYIMSCKQSHVNMQNAKFATRVLTICVLMWVIFFFMFEDESLKLLWRQERNVCQHKITCASSHMAECVLTFTLPLLAW